MAAVRTLGKAGLLALVIITTLSLQEAEAQITNNNNSTTTGGTPRWAVAVIVMLAIILALYLLSCCLVPIVMCLCKKSGDSCQSGCSYGK
ncbi:unnamed protein product [Staurois parvus]|uniref:Uncharacterized protein n=1 Tax=Staurois parvus TaxID=386267 RepID=A0ABN9FDV3_9NEOB|nr:unnamed protein product [Staurois parvus]